MHSSRRSDVGTADVARVSLSLPVFNGGNFIAQAIQSILDQDYEDFELIITDNASTDGTKEICKEFADRDRRIVYYRNDRNLGAAANFNRGFELSSGEYFKWCAHDDLISSNLIRDCVSALDENSEAVIAYPRLRRIKEDGAMTDYDERELPSMTEFSAALRFRTLINTNGMDAAMFGLWRQNVLAETSLHQPYYGSDCALLAEMALLGTFVRVPSAVLYNRDHPTRSVNLHSTERLIWQNPSTPDANALELTKRLRHLVEIAYRHKRVAPLHRSLYYLMTWVSHPVLLGRLVLEGIGIVSPSLRNRLRNIGLSAVKGYRNSSSRRS